MPRCLLSSPRLKDDDAGVREAAARALDAFDGSQAAEALAEALADPVASVRRAAAEALADKKDPAAAPLLIDLSTHPEASVRAAALSRAGRPARPRGARHRLWQRCMMAMPKCEKTRQKFSAGCVRRRQRRALSRRRVIENAEVRRAAIAALAFAGDAARSGACRRRNRFRLAGARERGERPGQAWRQPKAFKR